MTQFNLPYYALLIGCIFGYNFSTYAQVATPFSEIHPIEPARAHYQKFSRLSPDAVKGDTLEQITFEPEKYNGYALMTTLAQPAYLSSTQLKFLAQSLSFPANSSQQTSAELDFLLDLQQKRTPEQIKRVKQLAKVGYWPDKSLLPSHPQYTSNLNQLFFECQEVVGPECTPEKYPKTTHLLQGVMLDMRIMEFTVKYHLLRPRPYQLEQQLQPLQIMGSPSFASGHTLWAYIQAYLFSELMPGKRAQFLELAYEIGLSREIMGIHYPSDEEAARQLAHQMLSLMWKTTDFQVDFKVAKAEWEGVR